MKSSCSSRHKTGRVEGSIGDQSSCCHRPNLLDSRGSCAPPYSYFRNRPRRWIRFDSQVNPPGLNGNLQSNWQLERRHQGSTFLSVSKCLRGSRVMVLLIVPIIQQRFEIDRGQGYTIHKNTSTVSNRRLPLSSRPLSRRVEMRMACYELTVGILFSLL